MHDDECGERFQTLPEALCEEIKDDQTVFQHVWCKIGYEDENAMTQNRLDRQDA